jgi:hypothetical protein
MSKNCHDDGESFHVFKRGENVCKCGIKMRTVPTMLTPTPPTGIAKGAEVALKNGMRAIVDPEDIERVSQFQWAARKNRHCWYAERNIGGKTTPMHRFILDAPRGTYVDHINGDGLDNRRCNLRIVDITQNNQNASKRRKYKGRPTSSRFKGVYWSEVAGKWRAVIRHQKKRHWLGMFSAEEDAAMAYDKKARELHGAYARLNFPGRKDSYDEIAARLEAAEKRCVELEGRKAEIAALSANRVRTAEAERDAARAERDEWKLKAETLKTLNQIRFKGKDGQGLTAENWDALVSENQQALAQNAALREIAKDMHWMARRYVHDRQSYAVGLFNQHVRDLLKLGLELNATGDGTIWARDAQFGWPPEAEDPQASTRAGEEGGGDDS